MASEELKIKITADDKASAVLNKTKGVLGGLGDFAKSAFSFATGGIIASGIESIAGKLLDLGKTAIMGNADFEQYNTSFTVMLRNASGATEAIPRLSEEAMGKLGELADKQSEGIQEVAKAAAEDARKLAEKMGDMAESHAERQSSINKQMEDDTQSFMDRSAEIWQSANDRITGMSEQHAEREAAIKERMASDNASFNDQVVEAARALNERLAEMEDQQAEKIQSIRDRQFDIVVDLEMGQKDRQERLTDTLESIQERYGDRVAALKEKLGETENEKEKSKLEAQIKLLGDKQAKEESKAKDKAAKEQARDEAEGKKKLARLEIQLAKENSAYEKQTAKLKEEADRREAQDKAEFDKKLSGLRAQLSKEDEEYTKQTEKLKAEAAIRVWQEKQQHERKLADLRAALDKENAEYAKQTVRTKEESDRQAADRQDSLTKIGAAYSDALAKLKKEYTDVELGLQKPPAIPPPKALVSWGEAAILAKARIAMLQEFADKTPFELPGIIQGERILMSFGLASDDTKKKYGLDAAEMRTVTGDLASAFGISYEESARIMGRLTTGSGESLQRLGELGIMSRDTMAGLGVEFSKAGQITSPLPEAFSLIVGKIKTDYGGMTTMQSETFNGMTSTFSDWISTTLRQMGTPVFDELKKNLKDLLTYVDTPEAKAFIQKITDWLAVEFPRVVGIAKDLLSDLKTNGIQGVLAKAQEWVDSPATQAVLQSVGQKLGSGLVAGITTAVTNVPAWTAVGTKIGEVAIPALANVGGAIGVAVYNSIMEKLGIPFRLGITPGGAPPAVPGFASGGVVPGPFGAPQLAVVHGGETITPAGGGGGGGLTFVYAPAVSLGDEREAMLRLAPVLDRWYQDARRRRV